MAGTLRLRHFLSTSFKNDMCVYETSSHRVYPGRSASITIKMQNEAREQEMIKQQAVEAKEKAEEACQRFIAAEQKYVKALEENEQLESLLGPDLLGLLRAKEKAYKTSSTREVSSLICELDDMLAGCDEACISRVERWERLQKELCLLKHDRNLSLARKTNRNKKWLRLKSKLCT
uniref:Uncharacterized protein n=1 Tax=Mucochytrium quahogii TaxID=96639 RepID=A0A7S2RJY8_9STRA|mmetsp:Transcript_18161/g.29481  ORF Transcript_18161/g.29481 Transcript_18161/m.29481 type:complete len:176 (-) Transcript_18161:43-570(-)|eukprot:CAMPEP_0203776216 /NCGR_PEP_ID=MMETSP0099_2-20121227/6612_1 /ASSEMBLY_ACC=CAM_ASM_000209 /TAXON_ID=96639 /ORGANISM=" , Strain NY0313808BC1" /LENGTH=175 /DNA_ID=CAMNT_0050675177 /DNA_START=498 /DNA_END=1025 /DNA_ORIENTATION=+